jgi:hypothetical protein
MLRRPEEIQPAKILLQCQSAPTGKELEQFLTPPVCLPLEVDQCDKEGETRKLNPPATVPTK